MLFFLSCIFHILVLESAPGPFSRDVMGRRGRTGLERNYCVERLENQTQTSSKSAALKQRRKLLDK